MKRFRRHRGILQALVLLSGRGRGDLRFTGVRLGDLYLGWFQLEPPPERPSESPDRPRDARGRFLASGKGP